MRVRLPAGPRPHPRILELPFVKYLLTLLTTLALAAAPVLVASPAAAQTGDDAVTWSVRPADENGEDGRSWIEWDADPGESRTEHMVVTNHSETEVEFQLSSADGYFTDSGRFNMLPSDQESVGAGTWIDLPERVVVPAGGAEVVPFTVTVPDQATPGDHAAGVAASIRTTTDGTVGVESRVGFRVMTRVAGELTPGLGLATRGTYTGEVNPFEAGTLDVSYVVENTGNVRWGAQPEVTVSGPFGIGERTVLGDEVVEVAPGEQRRGTVRIPAVWPLFTYDMHVSATPQAVSEDLAFGGAESASAAATTLAMPWPQLVVAALAILLLIWSVWRRRRDRMKTARLIEQAREEALNEATAARHPA